MNSTQEYHYVYKITNTNPTDKRNYYIGVRSSKKHPLEDTKYMGSSKHLKKAIVEHPQTIFKKEIISIHETRHLAEQKERELLISIDAKNNPSYYNRHNATEDGFSQKDKVLVIDHQCDTIISVSKYDFENDDRYDSIFKDTVPARLKTTPYESFKRIPKKEFYENRDNYVHPTSNKVFVYDKTDGKKKIVDCDTFKSNRKNYIFRTDNEVTIFDIRDNSTKNVSIEDYKKYDYYVSVNENKVNVIDITTNTSKRVSKEEYRKNAYYQSVQYGLVAVIDTRDNVSKKVTTEEYHNNDFYIHHKNKVIDIFDKFDKLIYTSTTNFSEFCKIHNLSYQLLCISYKNNGTPLFKDISKISLNRLKKLNRERQIGWYAKIREY